MLDATLIRDEWVCGRECYESFTEGVRKGVLRVVKGPIAEWGNEKNRNGRKYTERLWDKALASSYIQEQIKFHSLFGEANHPVDRFEVDFSRVSHAITALWKVPETQTIHGTIEILDTPLGRIIDTLYEAGAVIGYSSRAGGVMRKKGDYIEIDEDTYKLITFDAVPYPSAAVARPSISEGCEMVSSDDLHDKICAIINESGIGDREVIKDFIYSVEGFDFDKEKSVLEGSADTSANSDKNGETPSYNKVSEGESTDPATTPSVQKVLEQKINALEVENSRLGVELTSKTGEVEGLNEALSTALKRVSNLSRDLDAANENRTIMESKYQRTIAGLKSEISDMSDVVEDFKLEVERYQSIEERYKGLKARMVTEVSEGINAVPQPQDSATLIAEYEQEIITLSDEADTLREERAVLLDTVGRKDEVIDSLKKKIAELGASSRELATSLAEVEYHEIPVSAVTESAGVIAALEDQVLALTQDLDKARNQAVKESAYSRELVNEISASYGLDGNKVFESLNEGFSRTDVHLVCEQLNGENGKPVDIVAVGDISTSPANKAGMDTNDASVKSTITFVNRRGIGL